MQTGSCEIARKKGKKHDKTIRRNWTRKEEEILLLGVKELFVGGWKKENGFRPGYLKFLEKTLRAEFPHTDLVGHPHVTSKLTSWKKNFYSLQSMLSRSGIGWNSEKCMIECDNNQWEQICKVDSNTRTMRYKSWPMYDDWKELWGKDRATGDMAEDMRQSYNDFLSGGYVEDEENTGDYHVNLDHLNLDEEGDESAPQSQGTNAGPSQPMKADSFSQSQKSFSVPPHNRNKRKAKDDLSGVCDVIERIGAATNERLESLANRIGYEFDLGKARKEVYANLGIIPGLSMNEKFDICIKLAREVELLEVFTGLDAEAKIVFVRRILEEKQA